MEDEILIKSTVIVLRHDISLIHVIENMVFYLSLNLKIRKQIRIIMRRIIKVQI